MNKWLRNEATKRIFKKRLKVLGLVQEKPTDFICFKHQAKPCSCKMCSPYKYSRKVKHTSAVADN